MVYNSTRGYDGQIRFLLLYKHCISLSRYDLKEHWTGDFGYLFFSLNMLGQPRKYGRHKKKLHQRPLRGSYGPMKSSRYCPVPRATDSSARTLDSSARRLDSSAKTLDSSTRSQVCMSMSQKLVLTFKLYIQIICSTIKYKYLFCYPRNLNGKYTW